MLYIKNQFNNFFLFILYVHIFLILRINVHSRGRQVVLETEQNDETKSSKIKL